MLHALTTAVLSDPSPVLLLFDDLQWCDRETLEWLNHLLQRNADAKLMVVSTVRSDEVDDGHPYVQFEMAMANTSRMTKIPLQPLSEKETYALAAQTASRTLSDELVEQLFNDRRYRILRATRSIRAT